MVVLWSEGFNKEASGKQLWLGNACKQFILFGPVSVVCCIVLPQDSRYSCSGFAMYQLLRAIVVDHLKVPSVPRGR